MVTSLSIGTGGLGRFGNQLWTIAGVIGIASRNLQEYAFPHWKNHDNALFGSEVTDFEQELVTPLPRIPDGLEWHEYGYFWGYREIKLMHKHTSINAHLQSPKFFEHCIDAVRQRLAFKNEPEPNDYCAIHYRAGDYIDDPNAYHPRQSTEYYLQAIGRMPAFTRYIVFSDDIEAAKSRLNGLNAIYRQGHYLEDFKMMKQCKHFIIANSSFSAMAALLADQPGKIVVAPKQWFGPGLGISARDIYHKDWIVV
ncbi:Fut1_Fut2_like domain containing protein [uncultured Caudovirales phage]|uniref:Fut1_Fut2_like domain containing protein n=1 Tax=uncultured Caudovirales phage TaxID=2100421 RepID=A0A6J5M0K6_9CAUD|nr:Fut1_Fut2_like domain containing protein [uncultured Caudovirales phage]